MLETGSPQAHTAPEDLSCTEAPPVSMHFPGSPDTIPHPPPRTASQTPSVAPPSPPYWRETAPHSPSAHTSPSYSTPSEAWEPAPYPVHPSAKPQAAKSPPRKGASSP